MTASGEPFEEEAGESLYLGRARRLSPLIAASSEEIERRRELTLELVAALKEAGLFRMLLPRSVGGAELAPPRYAEVLEELGKWDASTAWSIGQNSGCSMVAAYLAPEVAREIFGGADGILAWGPDLPNSGTGVAVEGGFRVSGKWGFASGSRHATWLGAHVPILAPDGSPRLGEGGRPLVRTMLFPKGAARIIDSWRVIGLRGTGSDSYAVEDLFVPQEHTCSRDNPVERREKGPLYRFTSGMIYAASFSAISLGIARATLDAFIAFARDKIPRGASRTLREDHWVQAEVGQCEARLSSSRAFLFATLEEMWEEAGRGRDIPFPLHTKIRLAATWAIKEAREVVATAYHQAGAAAVFEENAFERRFRDMHAGSQQGQGRPQHFETVGQILLGLPPEGRMFR